MTCPTTKFFILYLVVSSEVLFHASRVTSRISMSMEQQHATVSMHTVSDFHPKGNASVTGDATVHQRWCPPKDGEPGCTPEEGVVCNEEDCTIDVSATQERFAVVLEKIRQPDSEHAQEEEWVQTVNGLSALIDSIVAKIGVECKDCQVKAESQFNEFYGYLGKIGYVLTEAFKRDGKEAIERCGLLNTFYEDFMKVFALTLAQENGMQIEQAEDQEQHVRARIHFQIFDEEQRAKYRDIKECQDLYDSADRAAAKGKAGQDHYEPVSRIERRNSMNFPNTEDWFLENSSELVENEPVPRIERRNSMLQLASDISLHRVGREFGVTLLIVGAAFLGAIFFGIFFVANCCPAMEKVVTRVGQAAHKSSRGPGWDDMDYIYNKSLMPKDYGLPLTTENISGPYTSRWRKGF